MVLPPPDREGLLRSFRLNAMQVPRTFTGGTTMRFERIRLQKSMLQRSLSLSFVKSLSILTLVGGLASGCALGRSVIDVHAPQTAAPVSGEAVKIVEVIDARQFSTNPRDPSQPSLGDAAEIATAAVTSRAIGRKRGGFGQAFGDLALPDGKTVAGLVQDAVRSALHAKGYRLVDASSADYSTALPVSLKVEQFWAWMTPGFASITLSFDSRVVIDGRELAFNSPAIAVGKSSTETAAGFESVWVKVIQDGIAALSMNVGEQVRPAGAPAGIGRPGGQPFSGPGS